MAHHVPDAAFITHVQLAILGIIVVVGLFYIWRLVTGIDKKLDMLKSALIVQSKMCAMAPSQCQRPQQVSGSGSGSGSGDVDDDDDTQDIDDGLEGHLHMNDGGVADIMMKTVFGGDVFMMSALGGGAALGSASRSRSGVRVTDVTDVTDIPTADGEIDTDAKANVGAGAEAEEAVEDDADVDEDTPSVAADSSKLSRTKLKAMGVNVLKELCSQRNLSADGNKADLIQRIIESA